MRFRTRRTSAPSCVFAFCEPVTATPYSSEHIRLLDGPRKLGGGIVGEALCGYDITRGWDLPTEVTADRVDRGVQAEVNPTCAGCAEAWREAVSDPHG